MGMVSLTIRHMDVSEVASPAAAQAILEALPHPAALFASDLRLEFANARFRTFSGLSLEETRVRENSLALVHDDDRERLDACWRNAKERAEPFEIEVRVRRAQGDYRLTHLSVSPIRARDAILYWLGTATDVEDVRREEILFRGITETAPQFIWVARSDGFIEFWNKRLREYTGMEPDAQAGMDWTTLAHPEDVAHVTSAYDDALARETFFAAEVRLRSHDGTYRWFLARAEPSRDNDGRVLRWIGIATDIDEHKRAEAATELLLDATATLAGSREIDTVLPLVTDLAVRRFAESASVFRRARDGTIYTAMSSTRDPARGESVREIHRMYPPSETGAVMHVLEKNRPLLFGALDDTQLARFAQDTLHLEMMRALRPRSIIVVPLSARGEALGVLQLARFADAPFDERDVATAQILANRIAGAIDESMTRESERRLAETFQSSALPRRLPDLPGIEVRAIYQAAEIGINVGGDWYDAFELSPWRLVVSIGDVAGKGADAAATMSLIRHGIRFAAHRGQDPADILGVVDNALRAESPDLTATAFVAIVDIRESRVRYASAGHPPAALRLPNGRIRLLEVDPAPPLGSWPDGLRPHVDATPLVYGSLLVLYTDGLTEVDRDPIAGEKRLMRVLRDDGVFASTNPARYLRDAMIDDHPVRDDVAVITLAYGRRRGWSFESPDALRAQTARHSFERWLQEEAEGDLYSSVLIFGELVGNVVRHAPGPIEMRAEWRDEELLLSVFDTGEGFDVIRSLPDASSESGRGLFIIRMLARELAVYPTPRGSRVCVKLPVTRRPYSER